MILLMLSRFISQICTALILITTGGWIGLDQTVRADDILPKAPPATKYAKMAAHSPFAPPTVAVVAQPTPPPPPAPKWVDAYTATMAMQDGNKITVTLVDAQNPQHLYLTNDTDPDPITQMAVSTVKWGASRDEPPVITLRKGTEFAQVRYEPGATSPQGPNSLGGGPAIPGGQRINPASGQPILGIQPFRPPAAPNSPPVNQGPSSNNLNRRPIIRAQPQAQNATAARPGPNPPITGVRPNPAVQVDDDDDND